ncbi:Uu.00g087140.m01.CDS01 [Anthostomella pinea]|uniref:Uu.00g087140.m01.CDS01 n=1 Tax=Anthostomella pinea TaxID=933095 RepID=A0AAI8VMD0_9PEZI|nr:Uu.00g087140.m01.CDS01 [Anthostomella pinea]
MFTAAALAILASPALVAASNGHTLKPVGTWVLRDSYIGCVGGACDYTFAIDEGRNNVHECGFTVRSPSDDVAPDHLHFESVVCQGSENTIRVNGAWGSNHSIVLCFTDLGKNTYAWFGFDDWEIEDDNIVTSKESPAYPVGDFGNDDEVSEAERASPGTCVWGIDSLNRTVSSTAVHMDLGFKDENGNQLACTIDAMPPSGSDPQTWGFYNQKCDENDWTVSWGYQPQNDTGAMTLRDPSHDKEAWFFWDNVTTQTMLLDTRSPELSAFC